MSQNGVSGLKLLADARLVLQVTWAQNKALQPLNASLRQSIAPARSSPWLLTRGGPL
jgi:hypothetical protein